jgi:hypothetical protein
MRQNGVGVVLNAASTLYFVQTWFVQKVLLFSVKLRNCTAKIIGCILMECQHLTHLYENRFLYKSTRVPPHVTQNS